MGCARAQRLSDEILRSAGKDAWHGPSVKDALEGVTLHEATRRPPGGGHSIAELAAHLLFWHEEALAVVGGRPYRDNDEAAQWPAPGVTTEQMWQALVSAIEARNRALAEQAGNLDEHALERHIEEREYDLEFLLHGMAQHNAYHAGQISLIKSMVRE
jgi:uncharacterized damage-inducible protein DinB